MSDEGEKTCPLCAEEMDLTDQQLKPCKCGYEICVWCWHHIMDMAEKDNIEGRCPACRTPYNKEKIVGTASKCERLVTGMGLEKKQKSQKGKTKTSEGRKQLGSVRVIQRNLVYIVGLPINLADEDLLRQKEYFGQYGKVRKVSISRTAAGAIQQFPNGTCSVYITYSKEEEAVRSIQSAHGFVLEGRPLRACFGTTKYCHAWLRNVPCTNADCLYLHEYGLQEDSFTNDEIISAYTRNRVQKITGSTNDMQQRSGNLLPPPADDYSNNINSAWAKPSDKSTTNNPVNSMKVSPPNSSAGRSVALPAAASWGARVSNSQPVVSDVVSFKGPSKSKDDTCSTTLSFSSAVVSHLCPHDESHTFQEKGSLGHPIFRDKNLGTNHRRIESETLNNTGLSSSSTSSTAEDTQIDSSNSLEDFGHHSNPVLDKDQSIANEGMIHNSVSINKNQRSQPCQAEEFETEAENAAKVTSARREQSDLVSDLQKKVEVAIIETEKDVLSFDDQSTRDTQEFADTSYLQNLPHISPSPNNSLSYSSQHAFISANCSLDPLSVDQNNGTAPKHAFNTPLVNGYSSTLDGNSFGDISNGHSYFNDTKVDRNQMGMFEEAAAATDLGESNIISNILSMDFDPWDESLTSPQNLAKFLGESDKQPVSHGVLSSRKAQNCNQSRFSFARQNECTDQGSNRASIGSEFGRGLEYKNSNPHFVGNNSVHVDDRLGNGNDFSSFKYEESDHFASSYSPMPENKFSVSRAQVSAPPGFSGPSRSPPPGFTSHGRMEQTFDNLSGNHMFDTYSLLRKAHHTPAPVNIGGLGDLESMDPAILAVGGRISTGPNNPNLDMRSNFSAQPNSFENDIRLQHLMQRFYSQQNPRITEPGANYPQQKDSFGFSSRMVEQPHPNHLSPYLQNGFHQPRNSMMSNGHLNRWNEIQGGNDIAMAEILRNESLGFSRYYSGHEDTKFQLPTSGDVYNRTFGI